MTRLGLIRNPLSQRNKGVGGDKAAQAAALLGFYFAEPVGQQELRETLADFRDDGVDVLCIDGGDGTVREVLTALPFVYEDRPPLLSILASGKTNLIAADVGTPGRGQQGLSRLMAQARQGRLGGRISRRPVLTLHWPDGEHVDVRGMFMGVGAFARGTDLANSHVHKAGFTQELAVAITMAGVLGRTLIGNDQHGWLAGEPCGVGIDEAAPQEGHRFLFLATTLHRLIMGFWPFWDHGEGRLRYLEVGANPPGLLTALPRLLKGNPTKAMRASGAYRSGGADRIALHLTRPLIMDGETYPAGRVILSAADSVDFIIP